MKTKPCSSSVLKTPVFITLFLLQSVFLTQTVQADFAAALDGNFVTPDQKTYGKWVPDKWVEKGWSGYHVIAETTEAERIVSYGCGDDDTCYLKNAQGGSDLCPDGDCRYRTLSYIYQVGEGGFNGKRVPGEGYLGAYLAEDNGSVETSRVVNVDNTNIARFDETEAQQQNFLVNLRFNEAQVTSLMGFDLTGAAIPLGHIEEADANWQVNQTESFYKTTPQGPEFITTVVERVWTQTLEGKEGIRGGTFWCPVDEFALTTESWKKIFKNDDFDFKACKASPGQLNSDASNEIRQALQAGEARVNSSVQLRTLDQQTLSYYAGSDKCGLGGFDIDCDGTQYFIDADVGQKKRQRVAHVNSERLRWSMKNKSKDIFGKYVNYPNAKLVTLNFEGQSKFEGIDDYDEWIENENQSALALLIHEKTEETYAADLNGNACTREGSFFPKYFDPEGKRVKAEGFLGSEAKARARGCKMFTKYVLHYYILFPPKVNGRAMSTYQKMATLDRFLAAIPDQAQPSKELHAAEEFGDVIQVLARDNASGDPAQATSFDTLVDLATEEDSTSAGLKAGDFFSDLGLLEPRVDRKKDELPTSSMNEEVEEDEGDFDDAF